MKFDERMPGETALSFQYFEIYRDSSASERSLRKLTKMEINGKKRNLKTIGQWSSRFQWQKRSQAFDAENTRRAAQQVAVHRQAEIEAFISKDLEIGSAFQKLISEYLTKIEQKPNIQEVCRLALAYKETRLWMMELVGILQEKNNATTKRVDFSDVRCCALDRYTPTLNDNNPNDTHDDKLDEFGMWQCWWFCSHVLESSLNALVDIKTGFTARQRGKKTRTGETVPLLSKSEARKYLRKAWIWDIALQQATRTLPDPYIREKPVSEEIKDQKERDIKIEKKIAAGLTLADLPRHSDDFWNDSSLSAEQRAEYAEQEYERAYILLSLNQHTIEEFTQDIEIAKQLEAELRQQIPRNHPEVKTEIKRIKEWLKKNPSSSLYQLRPVPPSHGKESDNA